MIASRSKKKLDQAVNEIGKAKSYVLDVTQEKEVLGFFQSVGPFDHLVTTAADFLMGSFLEMPFSDAKAFFESKFWGQYIAAKAGAPHLLKGGSITFFCGIAGHRPFPHFSVGSAINSAIEGLTRALALELAPIRVNAVSPGTVVTPVWNQLSEKERSEEFEKTAKRLPVQRVGQPEDIAETVLYLIRCGYMTGSVIYVDGGALLV